VQKLEAITQMSKTIQPYGLHLHIHVYCEICLRQRIPCSRLGLAIKALIRRPLFKILNARLHACCEHTSNCRHHSDLIKHITRRYSVIPVAQIYVVQLHYYCILLYHYQQFHVCFVTRQTHRRQIADRQRSVWSFV